MLKSFIKHILLHPKSAPILLACILRLHNKLYDLSGLLATVSNNGIHPKHGILRYKEWFCDRVQPTDIVLDVGSNTGLLPMVIAEKCTFVYGIEMDPVLSKKARERCDKRNIEFLTGDATTHDFTSCRPFTCVILSNVLEHIENRVDFLRRLVNGVAWGDKSKRFLIRVPTIERDWISVYKKEVGVDYRLDRTHVIEHTREQLVEELARAGLRIESLEIRFGEFYLVCYA